MNLHTSKKKQQKTNFTLFLHITQHSDFSPVHHEEKKELSRDME